MLSLRDLSLSFGGVQAIRDLDIEIEDGVVAALIGPNGAGKTSVLNVISRFYTPQRGEVRYADTDLLRLPAHRLAGVGIARSFQNVALFRELPVLDNLLVGADHLHPVGLVSNILRLPAARRHEREARERAGHVLSFLRIEHLRDRRAGELSFGDQKLVDMGRALAGGPRLLLLDEPAAGMPEGQREWLAQIIQAIPGEFGASVLLIDHDMPLVLGVSAHVVVMEFGTKIAEGTADQIRTDPRVVAAYLGE